MTNGANRVDEGMLGAAFEVPADAASMADADRISEGRDWSIGGVPPCCHDREVPTVIDEDPLAYGTVWAAAGTPTAVLPIDPERLVRLADAEPAAITEWVAGVRDGIAVASARRIVASATAPVARPAADC